jgi:hypothetical protein
VIRRIFQYASGKEALLLAHTPQNEMPQFTDFATQEMLTPEEGQVEEHGINVRRSFRVVYALTVANSGCLGLIQLVTHCYDLAVLFRSSSL